MGGSSATASNLLLPSVLLPLVALYVLFLRCEPQRLARQRGYIQRVQHLLASHCQFEHLPTVGHVWDDDEGGRSLVYLWVFIASLVVAALLYEGRIEVGLVAIPISGLLLVLQRYHQPRRRLVMLMRVFLWYHVTIYVRNPGMCMHLMQQRRGVAMRTITTLLFVESLEECLLHFLAISMALLHCFQQPEVQQYHHQHTSPSSSIDALIILPLTMFLLCVVPMHVLGITEWLCAWVTKRTRTAFATLRLVQHTCFYSCLIPTHLILSAYLPAPPSPHAYLAMGVLALAAGVALRWPRWAVKANLWVAPHALALRKPGQLYTSADYAASAALVGLGVWLWHSQQPVAFLVFVSIGQVSIMYKELPFNQAESKILAVTGTALVLAFGQPWLCANLVFFGQLASLICLLFARTEDLMFDHIDQENQAASFLSHAIKQKYASVGSAVEHMLLCTSLPLLRLVVNECRLGHARCYALGIYRKLERGEQRPVSKRELEPVLLQLQLTPMASVLVTKRTRWTNCGEWQLFMDWELMHLVMSHLARADTRLRQASVLLSPPPLEKEDRPAAVRLWLKMDRAIPRDSVVLNRLVHELGGEFVGLGGDSRHLKRRDTADNDDDDAEEEEEGREVVFSVARAERVDPLSSSAMSSPRAPPPPPSSSSTYRTLTPLLGTTATSPSLSSSSLAAAGGGGGSPTPTVVVATLATGAGSVDRRDFPLQRGGSHTLLSTLRFALVDDNLLIRKNFERLMRQTLSIPAENLVTVGATLEETLAFPLLLAQQQEVVDVAIFDQNLDFDNAFVKGSDLAQEAKRLGFSGCLILHSSDAKLVELLQTGVFHGAVEKSADSARFVEGIAAAWSQFLNMTSTTTTAATSVVE